MNKLISTALVIVLGLNFGVSGLVVSSAQDRINPIVNSVFSFGLSPQVICAFFPGFTKLVTYPNLPNLRLKIPCTWTSTWTTTDYFNDGEQDYIVTINNGLNMVHKMYFLYLAAGCAESGCYKPLTGDHYLISPKHSRHAGTDPIINSLFSPTSYNTYYLSYLYIDSKFQSPFPFSLSVTNHIGSSSRVVFATSNKQGPFLQYKADNVITTSVF